MFLKIKFYFLSFKVDNFVFSTFNVYFFGLLLYACTQHVSQKKHLLILNATTPCHGQYCPNNKQSAIGLDHFAITYISHIVAIRCFLFQAIEDHVLGIHRCMDINKQRENYEERRFDTMGFIDIENNSYTIQHVKRVQKNQNIAIEPQHNAR